MARKRFIFPIVLYAVSFALPILDNWSRPMVGLSAFLEGILFLTVSLERIFEFDVRANDISFHYIGFLAVGNIFMITASIKAIFSKKFKGSPLLKWGLLIETILIFAFPFLFSEYLRQLKFGFYVWGFSQLWMALALDRSQKNSKVVNL